MGPICDASDLMDHEYVLGRGVLVDLPDADLGRAPMHQVFPRLSRTPGAIRAPAPELGRHTSEILDLVGVGPDERAALAEQGIV